MARTICLSAAPALDMQNHIAELDIIRLQAAPPFTRASSTASSTTMSGYYSRTGESGFSGPSSTGPSLFPDDEDTPFIERDCIPLYSSPAPSSWMGPSPLMSSNGFSTNLPPPFEANPFAAEPYEAQPTSFFDDAAATTSGPSFSLEPPYSDISRPTYFDSYVPPSAPVLPRQRSTSVAQSLHTAYTPVSPMHTDRSKSPNSVTGLEEFGVLQSNGMWRCAFSGCKSNVSFSRPCDLRKHFRRHEKRWFCRYDGCERSEAYAASVRAGHKNGSLSGSGAMVIRDSLFAPIPNADGLERSKRSSSSMIGIGYGTRKDRDRHERTHNPNIACPAEGCPRRFARADNMRDHHRRIHANAAGKALAKAAKTNHQSTIKVESDNDAFSPNYRR